jgi:hypothetical protein
MGFLIKVRGLLKGSGVAKALKGAGTPRPRAFICVDETGVGMLRDPADSKSFASLFQWTEVERVVAFKRDLLFVDLICLHFEVGGERAYEVNEEMAGWDELLSALQQRPPGSLSSETIFALVSKPGFATNEMVVFERRAA